MTVSAATLPPRNTIALGVLAAGATALLVFCHLPAALVRAAAASSCRPLYNVGVLASVLSGMVFLALYAWRLAKEARQMADALAATEMVLAREQQLHALDGLAAAAAHELGTPLSTIAVVAKELAREAPPGQPAWPRISRCCRARRSAAARSCKKLTRGPDRARSRCTRA